MGPGGGAQRKVGWLREGRSYQLGIAASKGSGVGMVKGGGGGGAEEGAMPMEVVDQAVGEGSIWANMLRASASKGEVATSMDMEMEAPIHAPS